MSSTVQVDGFEVTAHDASAADMVRDLTPTEKSKAPVIKQDRGVEFTKSPEAVELGRKGGEASARARAERAKEALEAKPEEKPAPEAKEAPEKAPEGETEPERASDEGVVTSKDRKSDPNVRIRQLAAEKNALADQLARQAREFEERLARIERGERPKAPEVEEKRPEPQKSLSGRPKPSLDDFATHEEWVEAVADWKADEKLAQWKAEQERERYQSERQTTAQKRQEGFKAKIQGRDEDWRQVDPRLMSLMRDNPPVLELDPTDEVGPANFITEAITQSDDPTGFALYLSENEPIVADLFRSSPWELPMKLGKIEARFAKEAREAKDDDEERPARRSVAPPPFKPIQPSAQSPDEESQSFEAQAAKRLKGVRRGLKG